jgi:hypothetical protein
MRDLANWSAALGVALALAGSHAASAEPDGFIPAAHTGFDMDFDVQSGNFSTWKTSDIAGLNALRATATIHRLGIDPKWGPGFNFDVYASADEYSVQVFSADRRSLAVQIRHIVGGKEVQTVIWPMAMAVEEPLDVAIDRTPAGSVTFSFGAKGKQTVALSGPVTAVELVGSTGEIEFKDVRLGRVGP